MDQSLLDLLGPSENDFSLTGKLDPFETLLNLPAVFNGNGDYDHQVQLSTISNAGVHWDDMIQQQPSQYYDKTSIAKDLQLPIDPRKWDTLHVVRWVEWILRLSQADDIDIWRLREQLTSRSVSGEELSGWTCNEFNQVFGVNGDNITKHMRFWLEGTSLEDDIFFSDSFTSNMNNSGMGTFNMQINNQLSNQHDPLLNQTFNDYNSKSTNEDDYIIADFDIHGRGNDTAFTFNQTDNGYTTTDQLQYHSPYTPYRWPVKDEQMCSPGGSLTSDSGEEDDERRLTAAKNGVGRPRKQKQQFRTTKRQPILYKFILEYLNDPSTQGYVEWVDKSEGLFRFNSKRKDNFAELWSRAKGKKQAMTYQNMARALRNYTKNTRKIMERVPKKLHYKFMPDYIK